MGLYWSEVRGLPAERALRAGRRPGAESAFAWSLLLYAARREWGMEALPLPAEDAAGRPYFPACPQRYFSLSHSRGAVLAALSERPVGADLQRLGAPPARLLRTALPEELEDFGFFGLWTLRESVYKLTGEGSLRGMRFSRAGGEITAPFPGVRCRLYADAPGFAAAAAVLDGEPPERMTRVDAAEICT